MIKVSDEIDVKRLIESELGSYHRFKSELQRRGFTNSDLLRNLLAYIQSLEDRVHELENRIGRA